MSVQFGRWNWEGRPAAPEYIQKVSDTLAPYGPDSNEAYAAGGVNMLYRAFRTTTESYRETQPHICNSGAVMIWDGRLDNRLELVSKLRDVVTSSSTDLEIVAAAYERWANRAFAKLIGDWALSIWNPNDHSLILAKDPIGPRHLYYALEKDQITWCTLLDPLVLFAGKTFAVCEEYIAGWFAILFPIERLTPYVGIEAVPASSYLHVRPRSHTLNRYWDFDPDKKIRYRTDAEYEEHFRIAFGKAIERRLRSDRPVLAELSGGVDSSCIVCMADNVIARGFESLRLDTISWYDESDPNWGERPNIAKVEEKRGRTGYHVDFSAANQRDKIDSYKFVLSDFDSHRFAATPDSNRPLSDPFQQYEAHIRSQRYHVVLSGIGGEEATGGFVPTPRPELQDLLASGRFILFLHQLNAWATKMKKARITLLKETVRGFLVHCPEGSPQNIYAASWFTPGFICRNPTAFSSYPYKVKLFGALPSFQNHIQELKRVRRYLAYRGLHSEQLREKRFPYLDRDLLEFVYAIPQEQLVRVGKRRSLLRRALAGIVPDELLNRKKLSILAQQPKQPTSVGLPLAGEIGHHLVTSAIGIIDQGRFFRALEKARSQEEAAVRCLMLTLKLEGWLRHLMRSRVITSSSLASRTGQSSSVRAREREQLFSSNSSVS